MTWWFRSNWWDDINEEEEKEEWEDVDKGILTETLSEENRRGHETRRDQERRDQEKREQERREQDGRKNVNLFKIYKTKKTTWIFLTSNANL